MLQEFEKKKIEILFKLIAVTAVPHGRLFKLTGSRNDANSAKIVV